MNKKLHRTYMSRKYLTDAEWLDLSAVGQFSAANLDAISSPYYSNAVANISAHYDLGEFPPKAHQNANSKRIGDIMEGDVDTMAEKLAEMKFVMEEQRGQLAGLVNDSLRPANFKDYLRSGMPNGQLVFQNYIGMAEIKGDASKMDEFISNVIEIFKKSSEFSNKVTKAYQDGTIQSFLEASLRSTFYWPRVNLNYAGIGTPKLLVDLAVLMLDPSTTGPIRPLEHPDTLGHLFRDYFAVYIEDKPKRGSYLAGLELNRFRPQMVRPIETQEGTISKVDTLNELGGAISQASQLNDRLRGETIVVTVYTLFEQLCDNLSKAYKDLKRVASTNETALNGLKENIKAFRSYCQSQVTNYFDLVPTETYPVTEGTTDFIAKKSSVSGIMRLMGQIGNREAITDPPLRYETGGSKLSATSAERLVHLLLDTSHKKKIVDLKSGSPVAMGGFILDPVIGPISSTVLYLYFHKLYENKGKNIEYIGELLKRVSRGITKKNAEAMGRRIRGILSPIVGADPTGAELLTLNAVKEFQKEYGEMRRREFQAAKELYQQMRAGPNSDPKKANSALVRLSHFQLKEKIYRDMVLKLATDLGVATDFVGQMEIAFAGVDDKIHEALQSEEMPEEMRQKMSELMVRSPGGPVGVHVNRRAPPSSMGPNGRPVVSKNGKKREYRANTSTKPRLTDFQKVKIGGREFWEAVQERLLSRVGVNTLYVPYVDTGILKNSFGLFDLMASAVSGRAVRIPGSKVTQSTLGERFAAAGRLIVANSDSDLEDPARWKALDWNTFVGKKSEASLRMVIYGILSNKVDFGIMLGNYAWPTRTSMTKAKVMKYCSILPSSRGAVEGIECPFLTTRQTIGRLLSSVEAVPFF